MPKVTADMMISLAGGPGALIQYLVAGRGERLF